MILLYQSLVEYVISFPVVFFTSITLSLSSFCFLSFDENEGNLTPLWYHLAFLLCDKSFSPETFMFCLSLVEIVVLFVWRTYWLTLAWRKIVQFCVSRCDLWLPFSFIKLTTLLTASLYSATYLVVTSRWGWSVSGMAWHLYDIYNF